MGRVWELITVISSMKRSPSTVRRACSLATSNRVRPSVSCSTVFILADWSTIKTSCRADLVMKANCGRATASTKSIRNRSCSKRERRCFSLWNREVVCRSLKSSSQNINVETGSRRRRSLRMYSAIIGSARPNRKSEVGDKKFIKLKTIRKQSRPS